MAASKFDPGIGEAIRAARQILKQYGIERAADVDLGNLAFDRGLLVIERPIKGAEGRLIRAEPLSIATINSRISNEGKRKFVTAHELGHYELHKDAPMFFCTEEDFVDWHRRTPAETEANSFAAELLMPTRPFVQAARQVATSLNAVDQIAQDFMVSLTAATFRYVSLEVAPSALVFCRGGKVEWFVVSSDFPLRYHLGRGKKVNPDSGAGEFFYRGHTSSSPEPTPATAWFVDYDQDPNGKINEQCLPMPRLGATLSLLWPL